MPILSPGLLTRYYSNWCLAHRGYGFYLHDAFLGGEEWLRDPRENSPSLAPLISISLVLVLLTRRPNAKSVEDVGKFCVRSKGMTGDSVTSPFPVMPRC